jgi:predicted kinase
MAEKRLMRPCDPKLIGDIATVHLVCGFLGTGKSTFARRLADERCAVRFSLDELYLRLFADGPTYELDQRALDRLLAALHGLWPEVARAGADVVLDFGFWNRALRDETRALASAVGAETRLYLLRCPDDVAIARCLRRNGTQGAFLISEKGYHELKSRFDAPGADEAPELVDTNG